ncbi:chaplin family protein [Streptomyces mayteni]
MHVETRNVGSGARKSARRTAVVSAVVGAAAGAALVPAGAAQASVVGIGNAVFGNTCVLQGDAQATGSTVSGSGAGGGNNVGLPLNLSRQQCGNSGIVCTALFRANV